MRFWITKNSESSVREQLVEQVILGILSEDLPRGQKLPSVRALARRHRIHSNTVSAAYQYLRREGWLEVRRGSGLYVRGLNSPSDNEGRLDQLLTGVLVAAKSQGYEPSDVLQRLDQLVRPRAYERILVVEPQSALREILRQEIAVHLPVPVETIEDYGCSQSAPRTLTVALPTQASKLRQQLPRDVPCLALRLRSVKTSLEASEKPTDDVLVAIVSRSPEVRHAARTMLLAVGLDPQALCEIDAGAAGWKDRLTSDAFVVSDVVAASDLPSRCRAHVFCLVADSSIAELKQYCPAHSL